MIYGQLEYTDPHLFDQQKLFLIAKIMYYYQEVSRNNKDLMTSNKSLMAEATLGYCIFDFSYLKIGTEISKRNLLFRDNESEPFQEYLNSFQQNFLATAGIMKMIPYSQRMALILILITIGQTIKSI